MESQKQVIQDQDYAFPYHYVPEFREGFAQHFLWEWGLFYISSLEFILGKVDECDPSNILDVGTGEGRLTRELATSFRHKHVVGLDYSKRAINLAKALNPSLEFHVLDVTKDDLSEQFDVVTLIEVFEHIPLEQADNFVQSLQKFLKPDGRLLVTVPHSNIPVSKKHFQHFTLQSLQDYFEPYFSVEEALFLDKNNCWEKLLRAVLNNRYFILNHWGIRKRLYELYKRHFFLTEESGCGRIFIKLKKR